LEPGEAWYVAQVSHWIRASIDMSNTGGFQQIGGSNIDLLNGADFGE
jgi:hypothetical protein